MECPYHNIPDSALWRRSISNVAPSEVDPVVHVKFSIGPDSKLVTAGSCFAQHISRNLKKADYNFHVTEPGHPLLSAEQKVRYNYGTFTARFGNVYTARQLVQLIERAYGRFSPVDDCWIDGDKHVDPFRPYIQPGGFSSSQEYDADREVHFAAVREMVESFDVFVFTLGLTESWINTQDGAVYAACPGCGVGEHDTERHQFHNFDVFEVIEDLEKFVAICREKNPSGKILFTVSPVPLIATFEPRHVLTSTVYSKSVLRVAAQTMSDRHDHIDYFPSYEIITGSFSSGRYFEPDRREVSKIGVSHAMHSFFKNYLGLEYCRESETIASDDSESRLSEQISQVVCEEENFLVDL